MDYGRVLRQAWDIIWSHKFLILLGVIVALTNSRGSGSGAGVHYNAGNFDGGMPRDFWDDGGEYNWDYDWDQMPEMPRFRGPAQWGIPIIVGTLIMGVIGVFILIGLILWGAGLLANGGLIDSVSTITEGGLSTFSTAFSAGWQKGWRLLGIGILPAIPVGILLIGGMGLAGMLLAVSQLLELGNMAFVSGLGLMFAPILCIGVPLALVLGLLQTFANRACMLEDLGVFAAYKRGLEVLIANLGPVLVLFVIQLGINIGIGLLMIVPSIVMTLCCVLWPVILLIEGAITAYFSAVWTLAWQEWTAAA